MKLLKNTWYAAAWSRDVGSGFVTRDLLGEPVLLYRKHDGSPVAMIDRCPHRFAPLSMGKRVATASSAVITACNSIAAARAR
jgi:vanillate O-demethylase monooxygenase subunit